MRGYKKDPTINPWVKDYDENKPAPFSSYFEANDLYGLTMMKFLRCDNFEF